MPTTYVSTMSSGLTGATLARYENYEYTKREALAAAILTGRVKDPGRYIVAQPTGLHLHATVFEVIEEPPAPPTPKLVIK